jgi:exodeoxyribonuclease VII large subunit
MARFLVARHQSLDNFGGRLATHSENHESLLRRGYAVVYADGKIATAAAEVAPGAALGLQFHDGKVDATADGRRSRSPRRAEPLPGQGQLL